MTVMVAAELQKRKGVQNWVTVLSLDKLVILYLSAGKVLCDSVTRSVTGDLVLVPASAQAAVIASSPQPQFCACELQIIRLSFSFHQVLSNCYAVSSIRGS